MTLHWRCDTKINSYTNSRTTNINQEN